MERASGGDAAGFEVVDWSAVDPAAASSLQMALAMGIDLRFALAAEAAAQAATAEAAARADERSSAARAAKAEVGECDAGDDDPEAVEPADNDEEAGGMETYASVAESWGDDGEPSEWILQSIVKRRKRRDWRPTGTDDEDWEYCCVWKGYESEPTWEVRGLLLDMGYSKELAAFDTSHTPATAATARPARPKKPSHEESRRGDVPVQGADRSEEKYRRFLLSSGSRTSESPLVKQTLSLLREGLSPGTCPLLSSATYQTLTHIAFEKPPDGPSTPAGTFGLEENDVAFLVRLLFAAAADHLGTIASIRFVAPATLSRVVRRAREVIQRRGSDGAHIEVLFHGTQPRFVSAISETGLRVPGTHGVRVVNGSAHGIGIYSATSMDIPLAFGINIFVCLAVVTNDPAEVFGTRRVRVFFRDELIAPFAHLEVRRSRNYVNMTVSHATQSIADFMAPHWR